MLHLGHAYQKLMTNLYTMPKSFKIVMPMYNLLEYSDNYSMTPRNLRNNYRDNMS